MMAVSASETSRHLVSGVCFLLTVNLVCNYILLTVLSIQAPPTVYYIPNFVSEEEGRSLWEKVVLLA